MMQTVPFSHWRRTQGKTKDNSDLPKTTQYLVSRLWRDVVTVDVVLFKSLVLPARKNSIQKCLHSIQMLVDLKVFVVTEEEGWINFVFLF